MKTFYEAIELVLTKSKRMRRISWEDGCCLFFVNNEVLNTTYIMIETPDIYKIYIPTAEDMIANDWMEV